MRLSRQIAHWFAVVAWAALIYLLSDQPTIPFPKGFSIQFLSALGHFSVYFILCGLIYAALRSSGMAANRAVLSAIIASLLYALSDEWHQSFVPGRDPAFVDIVIDVAGACAAMVAARATSWRLRRQDEPV